MYLSIMTDELSLDIRESIEIINDWGCKYVDLRGMINGKNIEYQSHDELKQLKTLLDCKGIKVGALQSSLCKIHLPDKEIQKKEMDKIDGLVRAADKLDCRLVRAFNFYQHPIGTEFYNTLQNNPDELNRVLEMYQPFKKRLAKEGLIISFENCGQSHNEVITFLDALNNPDWGLAWDVSNHMNILFDEPLKNQMDKGIEYANMIHAKGRGIVEVLIDFKVPWNEVIDAVKKSGKKLVLTVETHNTKDNPMGDIETTEYCYRFLKELI